ncbi:MAG TPA: antitoxin [Candidatus Binatia bacterium]|nr:antitoxin [Candidatus Binatia bacterium]
MTLDADVAASLQEEMRRHGISFKQALNSAVRSGLSGQPTRRRPYRTPSRPLGLRPGINLDRALRLAGELEDAEILHKLELRK